MLVDDVALQPYLGGIAHLHRWGQAVGAALVLAAGYVWLRTKARRAGDEG
jgi:hypothetical protein